ncbi:hypothetical protein [Vibrio neptunius]|uniref:hypothetical protein n=2 Tax=Vibrio neptunius TaxID=170651 RepID=UPI003CE5527E
MKRLFFILSLFFLTSPIVIAGEGSGTISRIYVHEKNMSYEAPNGVVMFKVTTHTNAPAECPSEEWAFSLETEVGKAMYSLLLSAAAQKQSVVVKGSGDCGDWKDRERPYYIYVNY